MTHLFLCLYASRFPRPLAICVLRLLAFAGHNKSHYSQKALTLSTNLKNPQNWRLRGRVLSEDLSPAELVALPTEELAPEVDALVGLGRGTCDGCGSLS